MKYKISDNYEFNFVDETTIIFSHDCGKIFEAKALESMIISEFAVSSTKESVEKKFETLEKFNHKEFDDFISQLIKRGILIESCI